jgi:hyperosmotically inducible periplasmic protein
MITRRHLTVSTMAIVSLCLVPLSLAQIKQDVKANQARLAQEVRHELVMLPNYSLFDNFEFKFTEVDTVILSGQVTRPILKSEAENAIRKLERVGKVINNIEVLPLSPTDDRIRVAAYREIFSKPGLDRYAQMAVPSIHIIVKNGKITLVGVVDKQADKDLAGLAAQGIPGTFGVTNNLNVIK